MAPKRAASKAAYPAPASWQESIEERRRRLRPELFAVASPSLPPSAPAPNRKTGLSAWHAPLRLGVPAPSPGVLQTPPPSRPARADAPVVRNCKRGSLAGATSALATRGIDDLVTDLRTDKVARTSLGPAASTWRTWQHYHRDAFGLHVPTLPITPDIVVAVGALFKAGCYRSFQNYASAAKNAHVEAGHDWTQLLEHTRGWVTRSVLRGIGPARQSSSFLYHRLLHLPLMPQPLHAGGPHHPTRFALLSVAFLLREIEASTAVLGSWTIDTDALEIM